ncbi:MAG TPA: HAMP domain-containing sensor histidine kinase, partial [Phototrophicaceae bacterium]|nr:HAMP domain-containing sensor histidine kinase [Phototrophicaceae bacterium]
TPALVAALAGQTTVSELTHDARHYVVHTLPVKDGVGEITAGMVMLQDITALKQAEAQRLQLTLERERLEMVNRFVLAISHEFRNSLAVIETARYLIERSLPVAAQVSIQNRLDTIQQTVARLVEQLDNLNTLSYLVTPHWLECDINSLVEAQVLELTHYARHKNVTLTFTPGRLKYPIAGDMAALGRALKQLLLNGLNYTPSGGSVQVTTTSTRQLLTIVVKDTGIGIDPAQLPQIFDLFYRADPARALDSGGVGVGLSIARLIAEAHGGGITVSSEPGRGSTFKLTIPIRKIAIERILGQPYEELKPDL